MSEVNRDEKDVPKLVRDGDLFSASDDLRVAGMQKMFALKQNGLLQEELNWQEISFIADNLYKSGHLKLHKLEQILDKSQPRENAVDSLIDAIIGNQSAVSAFMRILESESCFSYIAERIRSTEMAWEDVHVHYDFFDYDFFDYDFFDYDFFDAYYDDFLYFDVDDFLDDFLDYLCDACEYPAAQKRMKMQESDSEAVKEKKMVKSLRVAIVGQKLWSQVGKHLGLEFIEAYKGPFEDEE